MQIAVFAPIQTLVRLGSSAIFFLCFTVYAAMANGHCVAPRDFPNPELLATMRKGVNLPGWDRPDVSGRPSLDQLRALRAEGFTHIRLPLDNGPFDGNQATAYVDSVYEQVILLLSLGYTVSLDLHPDETVGQRFEQSPAAGSTYLAGMWVPLARMARMLDPEKVALELLNEPQIGQDNWLSAAEQLIELLRTIVPDHTIIVGPSGPQRHEALSGMRPFTDRNIVYAVHYYDPFLFTHQGATWGATDDPLRRLADLPFPASIEDEAIAKIKRKLSAAGESASLKALNEAIKEPWTEAGIAQAFNTMADWAFANERPVIVNEFGVLSFVAPRAARLQWLDTVSRLAQARCIGRVHWDFSDGFGLIDHQTGQPDPDIIKALNAPG